MSPTPSRGILLSGGLGTRLAPLTRVLSKQLLPIYDKPMVYYPLSCLMLCDIREVLLISNEEALPLYEKLLGNGEHFGLRIQYKLQSNPGGLAEAYLLSEEFLQGGPSCLVLGDNIFFGHDLEGKLKEAKNKVESRGGAQVFGYQVADPRAFGVLELERGGSKVLGMEEKPQHPKSHYAIPGIYFADGTAPRRAKTLTPSARGELEITTLLESYLKEDRLDATLLPRGVAWLDTGTFEGLLQASQFVHTLQTRQGLYIACLEEIAFRKGWIDATALKRAADRFKKSDYGNYLASFLEEQEK